MSTTLPHVLISLSLASSPTNFVIASSDQFSSAITTPEMRAFETENSNRWQNDLSVTTKTHRKLTNETDDWILDVLGALLSDVPELEWQKLPPDLSSRVDEMLYG